MYAIIKAGGKQYRVAPSDVIAINRLAASEGDEIVINEVLLVSDDKGINIGAPYVAGAAVLGKVVRHYRGRKIRGFHYKPKKDERKHYGHRQELTSVAISEIKTS
ncbi:MAG: 50S ribosomal protein L21 [Armatimonadetes bacterium]|nr:50S ribosomal protein L21 [Armatimonadota bacterium]